MLTQASPELFKSIHDKDVNRFRQLLTPDVDPNSREDGAGASLLYKAAHRKQAAIVSMLVAAGADVNAPDDTGRTPLHGAVWAFDADVVRLLLAAGANIDATDRDNWTPIFLASDWPQVELLLSHGARTDFKAKDGETLLQILALGTCASTPTDGVKIVTRLLELGAKFEDVRPDVNGTTLLMKVIERSSGESAVLAKLLLDLGADPLAKNKAGFTALHLACKTGDLSMVQTLLAKGADPNARLTESSYRYKAGSRPLDLVKEYAGTFEEIKRAVIAAGHQTVGSAIPNDVSEEVVVVEVDPADLAKALDNLILVTADIKNNVYGHPDYENSNGHIQFRFNDASDPGKEIEESEFFSRCAADAALRPQIATYIEQIVAFNAGRNGPPVYVHAELEAGGLAMAALLATKDPSYLPLFERYVESIDVDHTVQLHDLIALAQEGYSQAQLAKVTAHLDAQGFERARDEEED